MAPLEAMPASTGNKNSVHNSTAHVFIEKQDCFLIKTLYKLAYSIIMHVSLYVTYSTKLDLSFHAKNTE